MNDINTGNIKKSFIDKIKSIWNTRRYTITFNKTHNNVKGSGFNLEWYTVTDSTIIQVLEYIQTEYTFKILSYDFCDVYISKIIIECNKCDKIYIVNEFIKTLSHYIRNVKII